jgi:glycosyltransferase involved in cell wall biosynthesis
VVNTCHGLWARPEDSLRKRAFVYGLEGFAARFSDYELFQNEEDLKSLRPVLRRGRSRVVGNGIDLTRFAPDPEGRRRVREELGLSDDELLVGTIGRRVREKGLVEFSTVASRLANQATFVWVGPEDDTEADSGDGPSDSVRWVGERSDMPAVYSALDVFVLASHREGFSRASMEAAACGVPMVLADIRGCRELGVAERDILLVDARDPETLRSAIQRLLGDPALRRRLSQTMRENALSRFDQTQVAECSLETYELVRKARGGYRRSRASGVAAAGSRMTRMDQQGKTP